MKIVLIVLLLRLVESYLGTDKEELLRPVSIFTPSARLDSELSLMSRALFDDLHRYSAQNPSDQLIRIEFFFTHRYAVRLESLLNSIKLLIDSVGGTELAKKLEKPIELHYDKLLESIYDTLKLIQDSMLHILDQYEDPNYEVKPRKHNTFTTYNSMYKSFDTVNRLIKIIKLELTQSRHTDAEKIIYTLRNKLELLALSVRIGFLESVYNLGYVKGLKMSFIQTGIYYLITYEYGISHEIAKTELVEQMDYFESYMSNYTNSWEKLFNFVLFHIKEHELVLDTSETLHKDLTLMLNDLNELLSSLTK
ncbi:hypothetical protein TpMuguga_01g01198 [Theileria parva strain Muguga]|uniref:Uncharacterized protein n=1 Tax=Theileria parva TaxID=5875 RepID=Q4N6H2_THEPA|nr:uncharacterized protein TpMuguga_01g01198 [Theileria parva strain Muguga]EAN34436.1 hypothetical protein TpMuguga_01g01198 [Theileria parva strain Muguga]|eukprot:XP_766719.1 hypothetical protein [Theileria parva strain Muguga]